MLFFFCVLRLSSREKWFSLTKKPTYLNNTEKLLTTDQKKSLERKTLELLFDYFSLLSHLADKCIAVYN